MFHGEATGLVIGAVLLGIAHGIEPGHGWPIAASYAVERAAVWAHGIAASLLLGVGHLISSLAMVAVFFYAKNYFALAAIDEPIAVAGGVRIGGPVSVAAGILLILLGVREYRHGHGHAHARTGEAGLDEDDPAGADEHHGHHHPGHDGHHHPGHDGHHSHDSPGHQHGTDPAHHSHTHTDSGPPRPAGTGWSLGVLAKLRRLSPAGDAALGNTQRQADRGLFGIAWFAFLLGFAHEEEFEIIAMCAGSRYCIEVMTVYALTVIGGIVALTLLTIAGYRHFEERVRSVTPYLPAFSAAVLIIMGLGFVTGLL